MEMAAIVATNDVVAEVGRVVETTLQGMGFQTGQQRNGTVTVDVHKIWNDFKIGFWSGQAVSEVNATVTVRDRERQAAYTRMYSADGGEVVPIMGRDGSTPVRGYRSSGGLMWRKAQRSARS